MYAGITQHSAWMRKHNKQQLNIYNFEYSEICEWNIMIGYARLASGAYYGTGLCF